MQDEQPTLKDLRTLAGASQAKVAEAVGLSRETVNQMEGGRAPVEKRTELAIRHLYDRYRVMRVPDGRYAVVRRTVRSLPSDTAIASLISDSILYGLFARRDHAYRWVAALRQSTRPRMTQAERREKARLVAEREAG